MFTLLLPAFAFQWFWAARSNIVGYNRTLDKIHDSGLAKVCKHLHFAVLFLDIVYMHFYFFLLFETFVT